MVTRLTRLLLILQLLAAAAIALLLMRLTGMALPAAIVAALGAVVSIRFLIVANNFRLSRGLTPGGHPPLGLRRFTSLLLREYCASMISSSWNMAFPDRGGLCERVERQGMPVLLLHGYGCNAGYWKPMRKALDAAGIAHAAISLEPVFGDIEGYLDDVAVALRNLSADSPNGMVILVCHSMGGLIARAYLGRYGMDRIAGVITLGTPHHGTALAHLSAGQNCRQMERSACRTRAGTWLSHMEECETAASRSLITSIYSRHDNIVVPPESSRLDGACNIALDAVGHVELPFCRKVQQLVIHRVAEIHRSTGVLRPCEVDGALHADQRKPLKQVDSR